SPARRDEGADLARRRAAVLELLGDRPALPFEDEGVATDRDQQGLVGGHAGEAVTPSSMAMARSAAAKQPRGARAMPAPIWPTPGSRWAMPVLITGWVPLSTTRRTSIPVGVPAKPSAGN